MARGMRQVKVCAADKPFVASLHITQVRSTKAEGSKEWLTTQGRLQPSCGAEPLMSA